PVPLATDAPVAHVGQPIVHALGVMGGSPRHGDGGVAHSLPDLFAGDEPLVHHPMHKGGGATPALRVAVGQPAGVQQATFGLEMFEDVVIHVGDHSAGEPPVAGEVAAFPVYRD